MSWPSKRKHRVTVLLPCGRVSAQSARAAVWRTSWLAAAVHCRDKTALPAAKAPARPRPAGRKQAKLASSLCVWARQTFADSLPCKGQYRSGCLGCRQQLAKHFITADALLRRQVPRRMCPAVLIRSLLCTAYHRVLQQLDQRVFCSNTGTTLSSVLGASPGARCPLSTASLSIYLSSIQEGRQARWSKRQLFRI